jgi:hypothetical protein
METVRPLHFADSREGADSVALSAAVLAVSQQ